MTRSRQSAEASRRRSRRPAHRRHPARNPRLDISRPRPLAAASRFQSSRFRRCRRHHRRRPDAAATREPRV